MDQFEIKGGYDLLKAIFNLTLQTNIAVKAQSSFMVENANNGMSYEENEENFKVLFDQVKNSTLQDLYVQLGDLNLKDLLGDK